MIDIIGKNNIIVAALSSSTSRINIRIPIIGVLITTVTLIIMNTATGRSSITM